MNRLLEQLLIHSFSKLLVCLSAILIGLTICLTYFGFFESFEERLIDFRFQTRPILTNRLPKLFKHPRQNTISDKVVMLQITDECLQAYGKWPWKRDYFTQLVNILKRSEAKVITFDISFFDKDIVNPQYDKSFAEAIASHGRVVLASELTKTLQILSKNGVFELPGSDSDQLGEISLSETLPYSKFTKAAHGTGFVNIHLVDGVVRKVPLSKKINDTNYLSLAARSIQTYLGDDVYNFGADGSLFLADYKIPLWRSENRIGLADRLLPAGHVFDDSIFNRYAYLNYSRAKVAGAFRSLRISDILSKKEIDSRIFEDKIVIIGFNAGSVDKKLTPYGVMPGMQLHATAIENLLNHSFLKRNSNLFVFLFLLGLTILLASMNLRFELRTSLLLNILITIMLVIISMWLFTRFWFVLDVVPTIFQQWTMFVLVKLALLSKNLQLRMFHLKQLNLHSRELFTILEPGRLAQSIFKTMQHYTNCQEGVLVTIDQISEQIEYTNFGHLPDEFMVGISKPQFRSRVFDIYNEKKEILRLYDIEPQLGDYLPPSNMDTILLPLILKDRLYGLIILRKDSFSELLQQIETAFFTTLCQIIVAALENARLYRLATVDGLTGLFVRQFFDVQINKEFMRATRYGEKVGYLMSDIDHFKNFNDTYGHDMGDRVLRLVADEIKKSIRTSDIAARYGGEELCVILPNTDREGSLNIAERIRKNIENLRIPHDGEDITITCSIGVSTIPDNQPVDVKEFLKQADQALYEAKDKGRNQVKFFKREKVNE